VVGNLSISLSTWLTLAVITRLSSPETLGVYALAAAVVVPIYTLSLLHLSSLQATDVRREYAFGDYLALRLWSTLVAGMLAASLVWYYWPDRERSLAIAALACALTARSLANVCHGAFRRRERLDLVGRSMALYAFGGIGALTAVFYLTRNLVAALAAKAVVAWVVTAGVDLPHVRTILGAERDVVGESPLRPRWSLPTSLGLAITALPVGLVTMLSDLHVTVPRLIIESLVGTRELGIFVAVAAVAGAAGTLSRAGALTVVPRLASLYGEGDVDGMRALLGRLTAGALVLGAIGVIVALVAGEHVLRLVYDEEHGRHGGLLVLFAVGAGVTYVLSLHAGSLTAMRRFKEQAVLRSLQLLFLFAVCGPLTLRYGLMGAAGALVLSESLGLLLHRGALLWLLGRERPLGGPVGWA